MFSSKPKFDANKCKTNLKMLVNRFQLLVQKKTNLNKQQKRKVALLLRDDKAPEAEVLVEHIIREDYTIESYELLRQCVPPQPGLLALLGTPVRRLIGRALRAGTPR